MTTHKKGSDGGEGDDGEDAVRMGVKQNPCVTPQSCS